MFPSTPLVSRKRKPHCQHAVNQHQLRAGGFAEREHRGREADSKRRSSGGSALESLFPGVSFIWIYLLAFLQCSL